MALTLQTLTGRLQLDDGTDAEGNQRYKAISLGDFSENRWDDTISPAKMLTVAEALEACLTKTIAYVQIVATSRVDGE